MFNRLHSAASGIFGERQRSASASHSQPPPPSFPLPLGPPAPAPALPFPAAQYVREVPQAQYVHPYHMRHMPIGHQVGQAHENIGAVKRIYPPREVIVQNPGGGLMYAGESKSRQVESAERQYDKKMKERMAKGGLVKPPTNLKAKKKLKL